MIPEGQDMSQLTDSILKGQAALEEEDRKNKAELARQEFELSVKCARAEIAAQEEEKRKAAEVSPKQAWHDEVAKRNAESNKQRHEARQRETLLELVDFTASVGKAALLIDGLTTRNHREIRLLKAALAELEISINNP